jgi:hypothetical protein
MPVCASLPISAALGVDFFGSSIGRVLQIDCSVTWNPIIHTWYRRVKQRTSQIADRVDLPSEITVCIFIAPHSHDPATPPLPAVSSSMMPGAPRIPKRMSFFWAGRRAHVVAALPDALCARLPRGDAGAADAAKKGAPPGTTRVDPSVPAIQHLLARLIFRQIPPDPHHVIAYSRWRRHHQTVARRARYRTHHDSQL